MSAVTIAAPSVPSGLSATGGNAQVTLRWTGATGVANYRIYRDGLPLPSLVTGTAASYINGGLTNGTLYEYAIAALDAGGNESARTGIVQAVPAVPADTTAPPVSSVNPASATYTSAQTVTATNTEAGVTHRYTVGAGTTSPANPTTTSPTLPAGGLTVSSSSVVKVAAFDAAGNSSVVTRNYTINIPVPDTTAPPVSSVNPASATYTSAQTVTATNTEAGVTHRYTVGAGTTSPANPTTTSPTLPAGGLTVSSSSVVKVAAFDAAGNSSVVTRNYTINTTTPPANTAPAVTSRAPATGASGVATTANVTATFNEAVQGVSGTTATLRPTSGTANVGAAVTYNATTRTVTIDPTASLAAGTTYTATLTGGSTAIRDSANLALATTSWTFTTSGAPTVITRSPASGATGVSKVNNITLRFSQDVVGVSATTVRLTEAVSGAAVTSSVTYNGSPTFGVVLNPGATSTTFALKPNTQYRVTLTGGTTAIRTPQGTALATTSWTFTTGP